MHCVNEKEPAVKTQNSLAARRRKQNNPVMTSSLEFILKKTDAPSYPCTASFRSAGCRN